MIVRVKRNTGLGGMLGKIGIYVNDQKSKKIAYNQQIDVQVLEKHSTLQVKQLWEKSNKINVSPGDIVVIKQTFISKYPVFIILLVNILATLFIDDFTTRSYISGISLILLIVLIIISFIPGTGMRIRKTYAASNEN